MAANKLNNVTRTTDPIPSVGDAFYNDGTFGAYTHMDGAEVVGLIVYTNQGRENDNAITEYNALKDGKTGGHGLVMAVNVCSASQYWGTRNLVGSVVATTNEAYNDCDGYARTQKMNENQAEAAKAAIGYGAKIEGTTGWFLPSAGQWYAMVSEFGLGQAMPTNQWKNGVNGDYWGEGGNELTNIALLKPFEKDDESSQSIRVKALNGAILATGLNSSKYHLFGKDENYWSSSEYDSDSAIRVNFGEHYNNKGQSGNQPDYKWYSTIKASNKDSGKRKKFQVRPFLAF